VTCKEIPLSPDEKWQKEEIEQIVRIVHFLNIFYLFFFLYKITNGKQPEFCINLALTDRGT
jgi:hypothetical protein